MDANLKKFNCSFKYVLGEDLEMPGQKKKKKLIQKPPYTTRLFTDGSIDR